MIKPILIAAVASFAAPAAFAGGFYVNTEANSSFTGADYTSTQTDLHIGYEGGTDTFGYYVQGGPALVNTDGTADGTTEMSGKVGANVAATDKLGFYGEVSVITAEDVDNSWGTKIGTKYKF